jgi:hypothetical protein
LVLLATLAEYLFFKELWPLDLAFVLKNTSQILLNPVGDFNKTLYKER